jgi:xanthine/uracil/vitamin C permease (AzgA family)
MNVTIAPTALARLLERQFSLAAHGTTIGTEALAGLTTFLTMAYIVFVQPAVLSAAGMNFGAVMVATCLSTALATGHNFFFAYSVVIGMKVPWQVALGAVAIAGVVFIVTAGVACAIGSSRRFRDRSSMRLPQASGCSSQPWAFSGPA